MSVNEVEYDVGAFLSKKEEKQLLTGDTVVDEHGVNIYHHQYHHW